MKKLYAILLFVVSSITVHSQQLIEDFENWHNYSVLTKPLTIPTWWSGTDSIILSFGVPLNPFGAWVAQVSKETSGANGSATAIRATTKAQPAITGIIPAGPMPCMATNSGMNVDANLNFTFTGGLPYFSNPTSASFWVKTNVVSGDTTEFTILAIDNSDGGDSIVAVVDTMFGSNITSWTQITMPFTMANSMFSTTELRVLVNSSGNFGMDSVVGFTNCHDGTWIAVDEINIVGPNGVVNVNAMQSVVKVYPTLVNSTFHIQRLNEQLADVRIFDSKGQCVKKVMLTEKDQMVSMDEFAAGPYIYAAYIGNQIVQTGKLSKQ